MSEAKQPIEMETKAKELQTRLTEFFALSTQQRRVNLKGLLGWVEQNAAKDVIMLLVDQTFQKQLEEATDRVANTPLDVADYPEENKLVVPISEGYTVGAIGYTRHLGTADGSANIEGLGNVYLGASGCGQGIEENTRLLDGGKPQTYTNAGLFDNYMAERTRFELTHPDNLPIMPTIEPPVFSAELRKH